MLREILKCQLLATFFDITQESLPQDTLYESTRGPSPAANDPCGH